MLQPNDPRELSTHLPPGYRLIVVLIWLCAAVAAGSAALAQPCRAPLPDPKAVVPEGSGKFGLIAQQCSVLDAPAQVQRAAQLDLYDQDGSVTIRMTPEPELPAPAPPREAPVSREGLRVIAIAPDLADAARSTGIDPLLLHAIAHVESRHNAAAVSRSGARGLMQVMPATGRRFGVDDPERSLMNPHTNAQASAAYLRALRQRFGDDLQLVLAAFNAGEGAVDRHGGVPPYPETRTYVREVMAVYRRLSAAFVVLPGGEIAVRGSANANASANAKGPLS